MKKKPSLPPPLELTITGYDTYGAGVSRLPDGMAVVSNARHAANARQFIDFCLGGDVQRHVVSTCLRRPVRRDIDCSLPGADELAPFAYDLDQAAGSRGQILSRWRQLRGDTP